MAFKNLDIHVHGYLLSKECLVINLFNLSKVGCKLRSGKQLFFKLILFDLEIVFSKKFFVQACKNIVQILIFIKDIVFLHVV